MQIFQLLLLLGLNKHCMCEHVYVSIMRCIRKFLSRHFFCQQNESSTFVILVYVIFFSNSSASLHPLTVLA